MNKKRNIKILKTILPLLLGVFFVYYSISSATPTERATLWQNIIKANPLYIILSLSFGVLSHLSRAYRWKFLIQPMSYQLRLSVSFMSIMAGYLANLGIPRSGEVLRAATTSTYEKIPFQKTIGTIISERVADLVMLLLVICLTLLLQYESLFYFFEEYNINPIWSIAILFFLVLVGFGVLKFILNSTSAKLEKLQIFVKGILEGMLSIFKMKKFFAFIFHTFFIWIMYIAMFWIIQYAIPGTENLDFSVILVAFIVGSFAITITNGGVGIFPVVIGAVLLFFEVPKQDGEAFGWLVWGTQTILNIVLGGLSLLFLPILNKTD
ncbi:lysylphosphatidylglycerol synthase transmembrane domain-containing protein [Mesonia sp.]|uniref:lysylphosphatidylglycerol synthase transmembrane domain-containing protein n=1 Tax=Mesonia sp. TaxID=1960830 RepID=UPI001757CDC4|nr:lysylphosphatidylglycerol synthase transmembrane domain-containing protein [Mesonia sp.]HIB36440.1 flippase-like domain-containing protein [Mesonia sp.]HIO27112.1 flippase-like domain-containing protein [Flavobacteriaceae bacterium]